MLNLLLMPGMDGTGLLFDGLIDALPKSLTPQVVSYPPDRVLSYEALLGHVEIPHGPFAIVAESYSGPLAIRIAASRPENLRALVLVATFARSPVPAVPKWLEVLVQPGLFALRPPDMALRGVLLGKDAPARTLRRLKDVLTRVSPEVLAARLREILRVNVFEEFRQLTVPTLYLRGARDRLVRAKVARELRAVRPTLGTAVLQAPHLVLQTRPVEAAGAIVQFLSPWLQAHQTKQG